MDFEHMFAKSTVADDQRRFITLMNDAGWEHVAWGEFRHTSGAKYSVDGSLRIKKRKRVVIEDWRKLLRKGETPAIGHKGGNRTIPLNLVY